MGILFWRLLYIARMNAPARRLTPIRIVLIVAFVAALALLFAPAAIAAGAGRLIGELWVSVMGAVIGMFGG